jgi:hypothetical protein
MIEFIFLFILSNFSLYRLIIVLEDGIKIMYFCFTLINNKYNNINMN